MSKAVAALAYDDHDPSPDMVAWKVFTEAVVPANASEREELDFQTWATDDDLYGSSPPRWPTGEEVVGHATGP